MRRFFQVSIVFCGCSISALLAQVRPEVTPAEIVIEAEAGADVYLDDRSIGRVDASRRFRIQAPKPGTHHLEIRARGRQPFSKQFAVVAGKSLRVVAKLEKVTGDVEILTAPHAQADVDGKPAGTADATGRLLIRSLPWDGEHRLKLTLDGHNSDERSIQVEPNTVLTINVHLQRVEGSTATSGSHPQYVFRQRLKAHTVSPSIRFRSDSKQVLTAGDDEVMTWDAESGRLLFKAKVPWSNSESSISADLRWLVVPSKSKGEVQVFDSRSGALMRTLASHINVVRAVLSPRGGYLYTIAPGQTTTTSKLWEFETGKILREWNGSTGTIAFDPNEQWLAQNTDGGSVTLLDMATGALLRTLPAASRVSDLHASPNGRWLALHTNGAIELYDSLSGQVGRRLMLEDGSVSDIAFTPDSKFVAGADGNVVLWDVASGQLVAKFKVPGSDVRTLAISPDGRFLAGGSTGYLTIFEVGK